MVKIILIVCCVYVFFPFSLQFCSLNLETCKKLLELECGHKSNRLDVLG